MYLSLDKIPNECVIFFDIISMFFHAMFDKFLSIVIPKKLISPTHYTSIFIILTWGGSIFLFAVWKIINFVFLTFKESLFHASKAA